MKNIKILFIAFVLIGASTFGQTAKQKKQIENIITFHL